MKYIYLLPILIGILICIKSLNLSKKIKINKEKTKGMIDEPFQSKISNKLYKLSYKFPFKNFINENKADKKVQKIEDLIIASGYGHKLNYRVYIVIQLLILMVSILIFVALGLLLSKGAFIIKFLFNLKDLDGTITTNFKLMALLIISLSILLPKQYLKVKRRRRENDFIKDLPILQLFIILMLKAKRPLKDIFYVLSFTETAYKETFAVAYRKYIRNNEEAMEYLTEEFKNTKFSNTIKILSEYELYSKKESMRVLENGLKSIKDFATKFKKKKDRLSNIISQFSIGLPFLAVLLLGFAPIVYLGITNLLSFLD